MFELMVEDTFDAAHALRGYEGPCENLHGHTWRVQVFIKGDKLNNLGLLEDFKTIKKALATVLADLDHKLLNDIPPYDQINPSSENLAKNIFERMKHAIKSVEKVTVWESPNTYASYT